MAPEIASAIAIKIINPEGRIAGRERARGWAHPTPAIAPDGAVDKGVSIGETDVRRGTNGIMTPEVRHAVPIEVAGAEGRIAGRERARGWANPTPAIAPDGAVVKPDAVGSADVRGGGDGIMAPEIGHAIAIEIAGTKGSIASSETTGRRACATPVIAPGMAIRESRQALYRAEGYGRKRCSA